MQPIKKAKGVVEKWSNKDFVIETNNMKMTEIDWLELKADTKVNSHKRNFSNNKVSFRTFRI